MQATFEIELLDDCVFSSRNATVGGHQSLDHVPGSALLGVAASTLYRDLSSAESFGAFHSGRLRFGNGVPLAGREAALPMPLALHYFKTGRAADDNGCLDEALFNQLYRYSGDRQMKGLREGYVTRGGRWLKPLRRQRLKTAINDESGRAADSQLFGYQSLQRGARFLATLEADSGFDQGLFDRVCEALAGQRLLGRSRSGEYGRARIQRREDGPAGFATRTPQPDPRRDDTGEVHFLWLLSDLAPHDEAGCPTSVFEPAALGLQGVTLDTRRCLTRSRRYSPWNAARGGYDQEREVLVAGSVLCLAGPAPDDATLACGLGLYREQGLGRVMLDPAFLAAPTPAWERDVGRGSAQVPPKDIPRPDSGFLDWLDAHYEAGRHDLDEPVQHEADRVVKILDNGRRQAGVGEAESFGPSPSQWGRVMHAARAGDDVDALRKALFEGDSAVIKPKGEGWSETLREQGQWLTFADWFRRRFEGWQDDETVTGQVPRFLAMLARDLRRRTRRQ